MSSVVVVTPLIVAGWPVITAAVTAAIGSMGFNLATSVSEAPVARAATRSTAEIDVEDSEVLADAGGGGGELVVERDGVRAVFTRDARGALRLCLEGNGLTKSELKRIGQELLGRVTQQYVYHRVVTELQERHMTIVDQEVSPDRTVRIRVRNT